MTIGLLADPGLPIRLAHSLGPGLERDLATYLDGKCTWRVEVSQETLPLTQDGEIPLMDHAEELKRSRHWDHVVYLTDLPRRTGGAPIVYEVNPALGAALVCVPALGALNVKKRTTRTLVHLVTLLRERSTQKEDPQDTGHPTTHVRWWDPVRIVPAPEHQDVAYLTLRGVRGRLRLLAGMVRSNRPGRLLPALSNAVAAAAATGAFGIFYASIWNMADALHPLRLTMITLLAIATLTAWLIMRNGLWDPVRHPSEHRAALRDNAATILTVGSSVALMYAVLYLVILGGALTVISGDYLQSQLGHPVSVFDYAQLAWLAASFGTIAGALGSNFDSNTRIREATYSRRENERRKLAESYDD